MCHFDDVEYGAWFLGQIVRKIGPCVSLKVWQDHKGEKITSAVCFPKGQKCFLVDLQDNPTVLNFGKEVIFEVIHENGVNFDPVIDENGRRGLILTENGPYIITNLHLNNRAIIVEVNNGKIRAPFDIKRSSVMFEYWKLWLQSDLDLNTQKNVPINPLIDFGVTA